MRYTIQLGSSNANDVTGNLSVSATMAHDAVARRLDRLAVECVEQVEQVGRDVGKANGGWPFFEMPGSDPAITPRRGRAAKGAHVVSPRRRRRESEETRAAVQSATAGFVCAFM